MREVYKQYACPLARIVQGLPTSWGPNVTTVYHKDFEGEVAWSPCSRFIAVAKTRAVEVLDAATLKRVHKFESPANPTSPHLSFSPDCGYLTQFVDGRLTRWDLQTGDPLGAILSGLDASPFSSTYSVDGRAVAVAWKTQLDEDTFITTYDLHSMTHTGSYHPPGTRIITPIWTHGECLRFAAVKRGSIAIWEAQFTSTGELAEVESLPTPDEVVDGNNFLFLPVLSRLAFTLQGTISVWDTKESKFLLESGSIQNSQDTQTPNPPRFSSGSSFSSDGRFFACMTVGREVYVWKESSSGYYDLHQKLRFTTAIARARPIISPSGESIIASIRPTTHLWTTKDPTLSSSPPTLQNSHNFVLTLSPNETLAAFARKEGTVVTLLDIGSGKPRLTINTGWRRVLCLGMTDNTVIVVSGEEIVAWNVPAKKCTLNATANIENSIRTTKFSPRSAGFPYASLSPDLSHVVIVVRWPSSGDSDLEIYDVSTGRKVTSVYKAWVEPQLTGGGHQLWDVISSSVTGWKIVRDGEPNRSARSYTTLELLTPTERPSDIFPWQSTRGYKVTDDGWVLSPAQKRLLWLPHDWRSHERNRMWSGRFLGLLHGRLPDVVILEFLD